MARVQATTKERRGKSVGNSVGWQQGGTWLGVELHGMQDEGSCWSVLFHAHVPS
jgi:hypothetical protein